MWRHRGSPRSLDSHRTDVTSVHGDGQTLPCHTGPVNESPLVAVVMGSSSDWPTMCKAVEVLTHFELAHEVCVLSAHRMPDEMFTFAELPGGATSMRIETRFPSPEAMVQMIEMGMEEGLSAAMGQIEAILANG